jgi:preprotein translocase subunit SecE
MSVLAFAPVRFAREVRAEAGRVTWPSRRETLVTTGLVLVMAALTAAFFFAVDLAVGALVGLLFTGTH